MQLPALKNLLGLPEITVALLMVSWIIAQPQARAQSVGKYAVPVSAVMRVPQSRISSVSGFDHVEATRTWSSMAEVDRRLASYENALHIGSLVQESEKLFEIDPKPPSNLHHWKQADRGDYLHCQCKNLAPKLLKLLSTDHGKFQKNQGRFETKLTKSRQNPSTTFNPEKGLVMERLYLSTNQRSHEIEQLGLQTIDILSKDLFQNWNDNEEPNPNYIENYIIGKYGDFHPEFLTINIEHWPLISKGQTANLQVSEDERQLGIRKYSEVISAVREQLPDTKIGMYNTTLPVLQSAILGRDSNSQKYSQWLSEVSSAAQLASSVDYVSPSLYTHYENPLSWLTVAVEVLRLSKELELPVLPFVWRKYHDKSSDEGIAGKNVPEGLLNMQVQILLRLADGVFIWGQKADFETAALSVYEKIANTSNSSSEIETFEVSSGTFVSVQFTGDTIDTATLLRGDVAIERIQFSEEGYKSSHFVVSEDANMSWQSREKKYNSVGELLEMEQVDKSGNVVKSFYSEGEIDRKFEQQTNGLATETLFNSDGSKWATYQVDTANIFQWERQTIHFDNGEVAKKTQFLDSGHTLEYFYSQGLLESYHRSHDSESSLIRNYFQSGEIETQKFIDANENFEWNEKFFRYDEEGEISHIAFVYDDASHFDQWYKEGAICNSVFVSYSGMVANKTEVFYDCADQWEWSRRTEVSSDGILINSSSVFDNGVMQTFHYSLGRLQSSSSSLDGEVFENRIYSNSGDLVEFQKLDVEETENWASLVRFFDSTGQTSSKVAEWKDGHKAVWHYKYGRIVEKSEFDQFDNLLSVQRYNELGRYMLETFDSTNAHPWDKISTYFGDDGARKLRETSVDDVVSKVEIFSNFGEADLSFGQSGAVEKVSLSNSSGARVLSHTINSSNEGAWATSTNFLSPGGDILARLVEFDEDSFAFFESSVPELDLPAVSDMVLGMDMFSSIQQEIEFDDLPEDLFEGWYIFQDLFDFVADWSL